MEQPAAIVNEEIIRKVRLDPSREYAESIFWSGDQEIARFKSIGEKVYDETGTIPDGKVKFIDSSNNTYGEENYFSGKRHGEYKEFFSTEQIKRESYYSFGVLMATKEYFLDGKLRMEADYHDSLVLAENKNVGQGKVFYRNGVIMYEWNLVRSDSNRVTKAYNIEGQVVETKYFDSNGKLVRTE